MLKVVVLGSGASVPLLHRRSPAVGVQIEGDTYLFDCGEGTQLQWRRARLRFGRLRAICITHLHGDHVNGLVGLLQTLSLGDRQAPLSVYGPPGLRAYLRAIGEVQGVRFGYRLTVVESEGGRLHEGDEHHIECRSLDHGPATLGYALVESDRPGRFDTEEAARLGLPPGPAYGRLQRGETVPLESGGEVRPEQVMGPPRPGRRVAYCVDTRPCDAAVELAAAASLFICDSTFGSDLEKEAGARGHSTAAQAAAMARDAGAQRLLLTHISARYYDSRPLLDEARAIFSATDIASDLLEMEL